MKCTILVDNNSLIDQYYFAEPGASYYIEADDVNLLFDTGYSNVFLKNGQKLGIDFSSLNFVILSHGHDDHTGGLKTLVSYYKKITRNHSTFTIPRLIAHPHAFHYKKGFEGDLQGKKLDIQNLKQFFNVCLTKDSLQLSDNLIYLGEVPRTSEFENRKPFGKMKTENGFVDDYMLDDTAIVYRSKNGLIIITGCSHSGISNIISAAKHCFPGEPVASIIGGFHLLNPDQVFLEKTMDSLKRENIPEVYAGHCTDLQSKIALSKELNIREMGVGLTLEYPDRP